MLPKKALVFVVSLALLAALLSGCWGSRGNSTSGSMSGGMNNGTSGSASGSMNGGMSGSASGNLSGGASSGMNGGMSGSMNNAANGGMNGAASGSGNLTDNSADSGMLGGAGSGTGTGTNSGMLSGSSGSMGTGGMSGSGAAGNAAAGNGTAGSTGSSNAGAGASSGSGAASGSGSSSGSGASSGSARANGTGAFSSGLAPAAAAAAAPADGDAWMTRLVNAQNPLPENFTVETARISGYDERLFDKRAASDLEALLTGAEAAGCKLYLVSSYRSVERQAALFLRKTNSFLAEGFDQAEAERQAAMWVARPGTSEHNTGLAADLVSADWYAHHDDLTADFEETPEFAWLQAHCAEYGFILRYPRGKENITGVTYEPWHYRYVGKQAAAAIMHDGSTLEEYTEKGSSPQAGDAGTSSAGRDNAGTGTIPVTEPGFFTGR